MHRLLIVIAFAGCARPAPATPTKRRGGDLMMEVGTRFERAGRAVAASRWELAAYDVHELREIFDDDLRITWAGNPVMRQQASDFMANQLPALEAAARTRDASWGPAFSAAVRACNACHHAGHVDFIDIGPTGALLVTGGG